MAKFSLHTRRSRGLKWMLYTGLGIVAALILALAGIAGYYLNGLRPVSGDSTKQLFVIGSGASVESIAANLKSAKLIRSENIFKRYVSLHGDGPKLQAGTYKFAPDQSVPSIVRQIAAGQVAPDLVTILPSQRIDQVRDELIHAKYSPSAVDAALNPANYAAMPLLADKPADASLEGYLYPDSYSKEGITDPKQVVQQALNAMNQHLTPDIRAGFAAHNLSIYQGITMASIVEKEVSSPEDRAQVAQVIYKRLGSGMNIQSDVTAFYGARQAGQKPTVSFDSPWNTYKIKGLPYGPISNVSDSSLQAVAHPAATDWLYFVAGDDGRTYFSNTMAEHQQNIKLHCLKLCAP